MKIKTEDKIVQEVIAKIDQRSLTGQAKYGAMMMEEVKGKDKDLGKRKSKGQRQRERQGQAQRQRQRL